MQNVSGRIYLLLKGLTMKLLLAPVLFLLLLLASCSAAQSPESKVLADEKTSAAESKALGLNDVSIFMPINTNPELLPILPRLSDAPNPMAYIADFKDDPYAGQPFVYDWTTAERIKSLGLIEGRFTPQDLSDFQLVSIRIDPCTNSLQISTPDNCVRELRLVWQFLDSDDSRKKHGSSALMDSNIHTLYTLTNDEFSDVLKTMRKLHQDASVDTIEMPLLPHPVIAKEGASSPYLKGVLGIVNRYARASKLTEIASFIGISSIEWRMAHIAVKDAQALPFAIPTELDFEGKASFRMTPTNDTSLNSDFGGGKGHAFAIPQMSRFFGREAALMPQRMPGTIEQKLTNMFAVENPTMHNPKNMDCVSCHIANKQVTWLEAGARYLDKEMPLLETFAKYRYSSAKWNLEAQFPITANSLQVFSFDRGVLSNPVIAPRVINDSAETLDFIEKHSL